MFGLTQLGAVHTLIGIVAVGVGAASFVRYGSISLRNRLGGVYIVATVLTCLTAFGLFRTGAFGPGHVIAVVTLVVLAFAVLVEKRAPVGTLSLPIETVSYTTTFFLHWIPAINETTTRLPPSAPLASGPNDPLILALVGIAFVLYLAGASFQLVRLKTTAAAARAN
jgi:uncharacterized membrane protein